MAVSTSRTEDIVRRLETSGFTNGLSFKLGQQSLFGKFDLVRDKRRQFVP